MNSPERDPLPRIQPETGRQERDQELAVLLRFALAAGLELGWDAARQLLWQAWHERPDHGEEASLARLQSVGAALGLRLQRLSLLTSSARQLAASGATLASFAPGAAERGPWLALGGPRDVANLPLAPEPLPAGFPEELRTWVIADLAAPCQPAARHAEAAGGHGHHRALKPFRRLLLLIAPDRGDLGVVACFALGVGLLTLATPIAVQNLVNTVALGGLMQPVLILALILFTCLAFAAAFLALQTYVVELLQRRIFVRVVADLAYRLPRVRNAAFDGQHGPELVNRFFDVLTVQKAGASLILDGLAIVLQAAIGMAVLAFYHPFLLGFDIVLLAIIGIVVFGLGRGGVRTSIDESLAKYRVAGWLEEMVRHPVAFKLAGGDELALRKADALATEYLLARAAHFRILFRQILLALGLQALASTALLGLGGWLVIDRQLTLGQLVAAELIVTLIVGSFAKAGKHLENFYDLLAAVDKLGHLLDLPLEATRGQTEGGQGPAKLSCRELVWEGGGAGESGEHFQLALEAGECVAVLGEAGSGKTGLAATLFGLRDAQAGDIRLDGLRLESLRPDRLRQELAVAGGLEVFDGTVAENVLLGRTELSLGRVRTALRLVGLEETIERLPHSLQTDLATGGAPLSESQLRRLMLARALAGQPRLLVLDSLLDGDSLESAAQLLASLRAEPHWTLLVLTRRPEIAGLCPRCVSLPQQRPRLDLPSMNAGSTLANGSRT